MSFPLLIPVKTNCNPLQQLQSSCNCEWLAAERNFNMSSATRDPSIADFSRGQCDNQNI